MLTCDPLKEQERCHVSESKSDCACMCLNKCLCKAKLSSKTHEHHTIPSFSCYRWGNDCLLVAMMRDETTNSTLNMFVNEDGTCVLNEINNKRRGKEIRARVRRAKLAIKNNK